MDMILVGLGGTGTTIVDNFMEKIKNENRKGQDILKSICVDIDKPNIRVLNEKGNVETVVHISHEEKNIIKNIFENSKEIFIQHGSKEYKWYKFRGGSYYKSNSLPNLGTVGGAGRDRTLAKLLFNEIISNRNKVVNIFRNINRKHGGRIDKRFMVWIVAGSGGGTGSGIVIEVAKIIKEKLQANCDINLLLVLPNGQFEEDNAPDIEVKNSYCLLKEIRYHETYFRTINLLAKYAGIDDEEAEMSIDENIVPNFLQLFHYGRYTIINPENNGHGETQIDIGIGQPPIEMTNFYAYLDELNSGSSKENIYGTIGYSEIYVEIEKWNRFCQEKDKVDNVKRIKDDISEYKVKIEYLINGDPRFKERLKTLEDAPLPEIAKIKNKSDRNKEIWRITIYEFKPEQIGINNLKKAKDMFQSLLGSKETSDMKKGINVVNQELNTTYNGSITLLNEKEKEFDFKSKDTNRLPQRQVLTGHGQEYIDMNIQKILNILETRIKDLDENLSVLHPRLIDAKCKITESSKDLDRNHASFTYPNISKEDSFDKVYDLYKRNGQLKDVKLSAFIKSLKEEPSDYSQYILNTGFRIEKELSKYKVQKGHSYPINWPVIFSHDDELIRQSWSDLAIAESTRMGENRKPHMLDNDLKMLIPKSRWVVLQWITGYKLDDSKDFKELEELFNGYGEEKYYRTCYPDIFGGKEKDLKKDLPEIDKEKDLPEFDKEKDLPEKDLKKDLPEKDLKKDLPEIDKEKDLPEKDLKKDLPEIDKEKDNNKMTSVFSKIK